jgi:branched-chain amino acid transport system permease protein
MDQYLLFVLLGLGTGAVFAGIAQGVVVTYRGSGVINFAQGAMAMFVAYVYAELRATGDYIIVPLPNPLAIVERLGSAFGAEVDMPDIPTKVSFGEALSFWPAFAIALVTAALLGLVIYVLVFRPLRRAPVLSKVIATVGITVVLQALVVLRFGTAPKIVEQALYNEPVEVFGARIPADRFILAAIALGLGVLLWAIFKFTEFGLATRAAQENEKGAMLLGYSPSVLGASNWMLASVLAGLLGILAAPITSLTPTNYILFIIPALGAALIGGFNSILLVTLAGLALGVFDSLFLLWRTEWDWFPDVGAQQAFPFLVVIVVIVIRGRSIPERGSMSIGHLPNAPEPRHVGRTVAVLVPILAMAVLWAPFEWRSGLINSMIGTLIALSLVMLVGYLGQISLAQLAYAGVAAFALSIFAEDWGMPFPLAPLLAALVACGVGVLTAIPSLRARGVQLAVITLAFGVAIEAFVFNNPTFTGGANDPALVGSPALLGWDLGPNDGFFIGRDDVPNPAFGLLVLAVVVLVALAVVNLRRGGMGRRMLAIRANERAAAAASINVERVKLMTFAMSSFIAGLAGALLGYRIGAVSADPFAVLLSLTALAVAFLGGITTISGALIAGFLATGGISQIGTEKGFGAAEYQIMASGLALIVIAIASPDGLSGLFRHGYRALRDRVRPRSGVSAEAGEGGGDDGAGESLAADPVETRAQ